MHCKWGKVKQLQPMWIAFTEGRTWKHLEMVITAKAKSHIMSSGLQTLCNSPDSPKQWTSEIRLHLQIHRTFDINVIFTILRGSSLCKKKGTFYRSLHYWAGLWLYCASRLPLSKMANLWPSQIYCNISDPLGRLATLHRNASLNYIQWISHCR